MLQSIDPAASIVVNDRMVFSPVVSKAEVVPTFLPSTPEHDMEDGLISRMAILVCFRIQSRVGVAMTMARRRGILTIKI